MGVAVHGLLLMMKVWLIFVERKKPFNVDGPAYRVTRKYYINKGSPDFHRMVVFMEGILYQSYRTDDLTNVHWACLAKSNNHNNM